jgi:large subunit ribosomal protein L15
MTTLLNSLKPAKGATHKNKRVGRGPGSGHGKTACRGSKGQKSRSGTSIRPGFEGGQMPLHRRLPKRGFNNIFKKVYAIVNLDTLNNFPSGSTVNPETLRDAGIIKGAAHAVKILGDGELKHPLTVRAHKFSESAREKILKAGGQIEAIT